MNEEPMDELEAIIRWNQIPIVEVIYYLKCEGCGTEYRENDGYRDCCSFNCYCDFSCIDREMG